MTNGFLANERCNLFYALLNNYLKELELVELNKSKKERDKTIPTVDYDKINLEIAV